MKKIIEGKVYNTETAQFIGEWDNGFSPSDFHHCEESLYLSKKGQYFIAGSGGPMSRYSVSHGNTTSGTCDLWLVSEGEAYKWCEENNLADVIEEHFSDMVEEG